VEMIRLKLWNWAEGPRQKSRKQDYGSDMAKNFWIGLSRLVIWDLNSKRKRCLQNKSCGSKEGECIWWWGHLLFCLWGNVRWKLDSVREAQKWWHEDCGIISVAHVHMNKWVVVEVHYVRIHASHLQPIIMR
jgi:hypothetical protein